MATDTEFNILPATPALCASEERGVAFVLSKARQETVAQESKLRITVKRACAERPFAITDADRRLEQFVKERLDALAYGFGFFRDYDEPNEIFAPRLTRAIPALGLQIAALLYLATE